MVLAEKSFYEELCALIRDEDAFVSFDASDLDDPSNLVSMMDTSEFPLVLCAFLEAGHYKADDFQVPFTFFEAPSMEEVEKVLADYSGKLPDFLELRSQNGFSSHLSCLSWDGIQYSRFFIQEKKVVHLHYHVSLPAGSVFDGKGLTPVAYTHGFADYEAIPLNG